jgi:hypothetical protein
MRGFAVVLSCVAMIGCSGAGKENGQLGTVSGKPFAPTVETSWLTTIGNEWFPRCDGGQWVDDGWQYDVHLVDVSRSIDLEIWMHGPNKVVDGGWSGKQFELSSLSDACREPEVSAKATDRSNNCQPAFSSAIAGSIGIESADDAGVRGVLDLDFGAGQRLSGPFATVPGYPPPGPCP